MKTKTIVTYLDQSLKYCFNKH